MYHKIVLFAFIVLSSMVFNVSGSQGVSPQKLYRFDTKPIRGEGEKDSFEENYIDINVIKPGISFKSISYCLRIAPKDLFSQCVFYEEGVKFIFIDQNKSFGFLFFHGIHYIFKFPEEITIVPEQWYHVCVSYENKNIAKSHIKMYFDGMSLIDKEIHSPNHSTVFNLKPTWRLGYCKESLLDPTVEITRGSIRDFSAWSRALTNDEMLTFTKDCSIDKERAKLKPDVIEWNTMQINETGRNVRVEYTSFKQKDRVIFKSNCKDQIEQKQEKTKSRKTHLFPVCNEDLVNLKFTNKMTFEEATLTCHQLGGMMPLPRNLEEVEDLTALANESRRNNGFTDEDSGMLECSTYWLPIKQKREKHLMEQEYLWIHNQFNDININGKSGGKKSVNFLPWELGQPNGLEFQQCVVMAPKTQLYYDVDCKETHCFFCSVCKQLHFFLRGLSEGLSKGDDNRNGIDSRYIYIPKFDDEKSNEIQLEGYYDHKINLNKDINQWEISRVDNGSVGSLSTEQHYPFGKHIWNVNNSRIFGDSTAISKKEVLKLSLVRNFSLKAFIKSCWYFDFSI